MAIYEMSPITTVNSYIEQQDSIASVLALTQGHSLPFLIGDEEEKPRNVSKHRCKRFRYREAVRNSILKKEGILPFFSAH